MQGITLQDLKVLIAGLNGRVLDGSVVTEDDRRFLDAAQRVDQFVADVETEVAPDWTKAPDWARFWAADASGIAYWWNCRPTRKYGAWTIPFDKNGTAISNGTFELPVGYDWRLSLHERPEGV